MMVLLKELRSERLKKLERLKTLGVNAYPIVSRVNFSLAAARKGFQVLRRRKKTLRLGGRVVSLRIQGGVIFFDLDDGSGRLQALIKKGEIGEKAREIFLETADAGDFIVVDGALFVSRRGEKTILVKNWQMAAKSLRPLPDKWFGLKDQEERYRRRYLEILTSPEAKKRFVLRSKLISVVRAFLDRRGFLEVETPALQPVAGGASAKPFSTRHEALDIDLYLRIAEELYLKRFLIGGFPKVYSVSKNFRNEGIDATHNPEFTMLEFYEAWSTAADQRRLVTSLLKETAKKLLGKLEFEYAGQLVKLGPGFETVAFFDLIKSYADIVNPGLASREELSLRAKQLGVGVREGESREKILDGIYGKVCRPRLIQPTFVVDYPAGLLPLAKRREDDPGLADAFQLVIGGLEVVKAFSELNDPLDQRQRFEEQERQRRAGDIEAQKMDEEFLEALEYGMPPAGGVGIGIDRLAMLFTDAPNIREVIFSPILRPKSQKETADSDPNQR